MAKGYVIGGGGGSAFDKTGGPELPIFINDEGEAQVCTSIGLISNKAKQLVDNSGSGYTVGDNGKQLIYFLNGVPKVSSSTVGSSTRPVYLSAGIITQCSDTLASNISGNAATATVASKLGTANVGSGTKPIYLASGVATASSSTVGSSTKPVYLNAGTVTQCNDTIANSISGNAATATKLQTSRTINGASFDGTANITTSNWGTARNISISDSDGTNTGSSVSVNGSGNVTLKLPSTIKASISGNAATATTATTANNGSWNSGNNFYIAGHKSSDNKFYYNTSVSVTSSNVLKGAAWNDYAESRLCSEKPGTCVIESTDGKLIKSTKRLQKAGNIVSDTYGFIIGNDGDQYSAIAIAGRVLAYSDRKLKVGDVVCSGKNGTVSKMNRLEIMLFPDRIIGVVSEIPTYDKWNSINVDNRIWIKVK